jgi:predicted dehydrogenase
VSRAAGRRPRLGFLGVGWIGRNRLEAIVQSEVAEVAAIADPARKLVEEAKALAPEALALETLEELLEEELEGIVIATPSALHAEQTTRALAAGAAVFCQKPLGRDAEETRGAVEAARRADRLLAVDLSYRFLAGAQRIRELVREGALGEVYAANLVFHNAYGPDKAWFYDPRLSGGGCLIDLGVHLLDLALWTLDFPEVTQLSGRLFAGGRPLQAREVVEDYACSQLELGTGATLALACSWRLSAGCDAVIEASFYGTKGGASLRNVNGSFYDFIAESYQGTRREVLHDQPEPWGGKAAVSWARRLAVDPSFDPEVERLIGVSQAMDAIYRTGRREGASGPGSRPGGNLA